MRIHSQHLHRAPARLAARLVLVLAAALFAALAGAATPLRVTVSIPPYANIVERIGGERVTVTTLLPPGASPHVFDPTPSQAAGLAKADLIVMNGGLDSWLDRLLAATAPNVPIVVMMEHMPLDQLVTNLDTDEDEGEVHGADGHDHAGLNSHIWLDPILMIDAASAIATTLEGLDPANAAAYAAGYEQLRADLLALDAELRQTLAPVAGAPFIPFHDAWPYFASRYGLDLVLSLEPFPGREPSSKYVADAVATVKRVGAKAVFDERQLNPRSAEVVAESAGVGLARLDPLGGAPGPTTYEELLRFNASVILATLR